MEELLKTDPKTYRKCPKCSAIIMKASGYYYIFNN